MSSVTLTGQFNVPIVSRRRPPATSRSPSDRWGWTLVVLICLGWGVGLAAGFETGLAALTFLGVAGTLLGLVKPVAGLMSVSVLCSLDALTRNYLLTGGLLRWNTVNYVLILITFLNLPILFKMRSLPLRFLCLLVGLLVVELVYTNHSEDGIQHVLGPISCFGLIVCFARAANDPRQWSWIGIITGVLAGIGGLTFNLQKGGVDDINKNAWAFFPLTAMFAICLGFRLAEGRRKTQLCLLALALLNCGWVFLSGSRGALLVGLFCLLFLFHQIKRLSQRVSLVALAVVIGIGLSVRFASQQESSLQRLDKLFDSDRSIGNRTSGRSDLAKAGWSIFSRNPILGIGTGSFGREYAKVSVAEGLSYRTGFSRAAHSAWVKILAENGLPGMLIFCLFIASFAFVGWKKKSAGVLPIGILVSSVLAVSFLSTEFQAKGLWLLVGGSTVLLTRGYTARRGPPMRRPPQTIPRPLALQNQPDGGF